MRSMMRLWGNGIRRERRADDLRNLARAGRKGEGKKTERKRESCAAAKVLDGGA